MIQLNLQLFGGGKSGGGAGGGGHKGSAGGQGQFTTTKTDKKEVSKAEPEKKKENVRVEDIIDSRGNAKRIADGFRYNIYTYKNGDKNMFYDKVPAKEVREIIEGYKYDEKDGTFKNEDDDRKYIIEVIRKTTTAKKNLAKKKKK